MVSGRLIPSPGQYFCAAFRRIKEISVVSVIIKKVRLCKLLREHSTILISFLLGVINVLYTLSSTSKHVENLHSASPCNQELLRFDVNDGLWNSTNCMRSVICIHVICRHMWDVEFEY